MDDRSGRLISYLGSITPVRLEEGVGGPRGEAEAIAGRAEAAGRGMDAKPIRAVLEKVALRQDLSPHEQFVAEAIIIPDRRPAVLVANGSYALNHPDWLHYENDASIKRRITTAIASVGRIELPGHPSLPFGGTGFVVGRDLIMTNRHVAQSFTGGVGQGNLSFITGLSSAIDFEREHTSTASVLLKVTGIVMVHPFWDMALLRVEGLPEKHPVIELSAESPEALAGRDVAVIGYPGFSPYNPAEVQQQVFNGIYDVKRMQPGKLQGRMPVTSFEHEVSALTHDSSTLGGNSGSAVIDVSTGRVAGLHFGGIYLARNYAVPSFELAREKRVADVGVRFGPGAMPGPVEWDGFWSGLERPAAAAAQPAAVSVVQPAAGAAFPIEITIRIGAASTG